jgi:hypothetical protein
MRRYSMPAGGFLIRGVDVSPLLAPNGNGIKVEAQIRFSVAKVESTLPEVTVHDLSGHRLRFVAAVDGGRS